jgi:hypothetical protein
MNCFVESFDKPKFLCYICGLNKAIVFESRLFLKFMKMRNRRKDLGGE